MTTALSWLWIRLGPIRWLIIWLISPKFTLGVNAYITNEHGQVWLQQHRFWPDQTWGLPGGLVGSDEDPDAALIREVKEETGRSLHALQLVASKKFYRRGLALCYTGQFGSEALHLDDGEIIQAGFYDPGELPQPFLKNHKDIIEYIRTKGST